MNLLLRAFTLNDQPLTQAIEGVFGPAGGTIGRSDSNTIALPDPERHISRLQAEVQGDGVQYTIRNAGGANPILLNGQPVMPGERRAIGPGDELRIGGYLLHVFDPANPEVPRTVTRTRPPVDARTVIAASAREHRTDPPARPRPAASPSPVAPPPMSAPPVAAVAPVAVTPPAPPPAAPVADPFADLLGPAAAPPAGTGGSPFADLLGPAPTAATPAAGAPIAANNPFGDLLGGAPGNGADPFAGLGLGGPVPAPVPTPSVPPPSVSASAPAPYNAFGAAPVSAPVARLPDDFDPFADLAPPAASPATVPETDLLASVGASSGGEGTIDDFFGLGAPAASSGADPLAAFLAPTPAAPTAASAVAGEPLASTDPLALFGGSAPAAPLAAPSVANHVPELQAAFVPPQALAEPLPPPPVMAPPPAAAPVTAQPPRAAKPVPAPPPPVEVASKPVAPRPTSSAAGAPAGDALWQAFCEGAGLDAARLPAPDADQMRQLGVMMREAIDGIVRLVQVRATVKQELHAQVTVIRSRNNNPLKFSPDAQAALMQLLQPPLRGFMPGPAAVQDAMHDLVGHSVGTMAGTRAALQGVLKRFEPQQLEAKLTTKGVMDSLLPMNRKARLWELYLQHYGTISGEAEDDFHALFGKAFLAAYEEALDALPHGTAA